MTLLERAEKLGIDVASHRCDCEACMQTSALCTAALSSLALEVQRKEGAQAPRYDDVFFDGVEWLDSL